MTLKSAHREISLWRYDLPSRSYFGYHLRAKSPDARARLRSRLAELENGAPHLLHFGTEIPDALSDLWPRIFFAEVQITIGNTPAETTTDLSFALAPSDLSGLLDLLDSVENHHEACVTVQTCDGSVPLWVWWDP